MFIKILPDGKLTLVNADTVEELKKLFEEERQNNIEELEKVKISNLELADKVVVADENDIVNIKTKVHYQFNAFKQQQMIDRLKQDISFTSERIFEIELKEING